MAEDLRESMCIQYEEKKMVMGLSLKDCTAKQATDLHGRDAKRMKNGLINPPYGKNED